MKKALKKIEIWYYEGDKKIEGAPAGIRGNLTGIRGNLTGITGNLDDCEITEDDRKKGIRIEDLIK